MARLPEIIPSVGLFIVYKQAHLSPEREGEMEVSATNRTKTNLEVCESCVLSSAYISP